MSMVEAPSVRHRLEGLEPDNLLAFLALLGLLRALEAADREAPEAERLHPRASWDLDFPPLRPVVHLARPQRTIDVCHRAQCGLAALLPDHDFGGRRGLDFTRGEARTLLEGTAMNASAGTAGRADLVAALMSDIVLKDETRSGRDVSVQGTPFCLLFGQGHQHFLQRLAAVPATQAPPARGKGKAAQQIDASTCLHEALFEPWHRKDPTQSFRWDPEEDVRYALLAGDPTVAKYKAGTQHGANRLAAVGLVALPTAPVLRGQRVRLAVPGGAVDGGGFSFSWPIWRPPATLAAIRALLNHPALRKPGALARFGVEEVLVTRRISVGKFMNFTRARQLPSVSQ